MEFLSEKKYQNKIKHFFSNKNPLDIAVAFWGKDALSLFKPGSDKTVRLICNLESSACNPIIIKKLMDYNKVTVKTNSRLHAKVLLQQNELIIGSANISANGLSLEGSELNGWIEAGVLTDDDSIIKNASNWFSSLWKFSEIITEEKLALALEKWEKRRNQRDVKTHQMSLLNAASNNIANFEDREIYFVMYRDGNLSSEASVKLEDVKQVHTNLSEKVECYEGWRELPDNAYLIDIYYGPRKGVQVTGIYWTPDDPIVEDFNYNDGSTGDIKICFKKNLVFGYKITAKDKEVIKSHVDVLWNYDQDESSSIIPFVDGVELLNKHLTNK
jgi:HKD family nuclease